MPPVGPVPPPTFPDWQDEGSYCDKWGCPDTWCLDRWIWELQRRKYYFFPDDRTAKLLPNDPHPAFGDFDNRTGIAWYHGIGLPWHDGGGVLRIDASEGHLLIRFELDRPLAIQIEKAREILEQAQIKRVGRKIAAGFHERNFFSYLRILDGRNAGASWSQLIEALPRHIANRTPQSARDFYGQAKALCLKL